MCKILKINRSLVYYHLNNIKNNKNKYLNEDLILTGLIKDIFRKSRNNYGTRKIKYILEEEGYKVSRRRIARLMKANGLVSNYTVLQYKVHKSKCNEAKIENIVSREFDDREYLEAAVSDLTYVKVGSSWNYVCTIIDLYNREIIGYAAGKNKDAALIKKAFYSCKYPLTEIEIFHSDRGLEYDNSSIDEILNTFNIKRSLSRKGNPYDNAVCESLNNVIKTEFIKQSEFLNIEQLQLELAEYIYWYNEIRIHGSLNYLTPIKFRENNIKTKVA